MIRELPALAISARPLPVARLLRHSINAKSAKESHDAAYFAWEVSVRIAVAASPPADASRLRVGSVGEWVRAVQPGIDDLTGPACRALYGHMTQVVEGRRRAQSSVRARHLLESLAAYRNITIGHGTIREQESFYVQGAQALRAALDEAWANSLFLPAGSTLVYTTGVHERSTENARALTLVLSGESPIPGKPDGDLVPPSIRAGTVCLQHGNKWTDLHPWLLFDDRRERLYCFHAFKRRPEYLDFGSGEWLRGDALEVLSPGTTAALSPRLGQGVLPTEKPIADEREFGDFLLLGVLGEGGMGRVHLAEQRSLGRLVALKVLPRDTARNPSALARFQREIEALGRCEHPNVVKIFESGVERGQPYYAMEYVQGVDLRRVAEHLPGFRDFEDALVAAWDEQSVSRSELKTLLPEPGNLRERQRRASIQNSIATIVRDAALGVQSLHEQGILHRDISPANIVVTVPDHRAVVMDLGLVAFEGRDVSESVDSPRLLGTLRYMAPEQLDGRVTVDRRVDVYGLGAVLYELLLGHPLFDGHSNVRLMDQVVKSKPAPLSIRGPQRIAADLSMIASKAIEKDPSQRYASVDALARDLSAFLGGYPISARPPSFSYLAYRWTKRNPWLAGTIGLLALLAIVGYVSISSLSGRSQEQQSRLTRISDQDRLQDLEAAQGELGGLPEDVPRYDLWLERAADVAARLPTHAAELRRTDSEATFKTGSSEVLASGSASSERRLSSAEMERTQLAQLVARLKDLDRPGGRMDRVRAARQQIVRFAEWSLNPSEWKTAIDSIANRTECPAYDGLVIDPQFGLIPLGRDSRSGFWEFLHVQSGGPPCVYSNGEFEPHADMGIIFVLLPGGAAAMGGQRLDSTQLLYDDQAQADQSPPTAYNLDPFFLSKYEMTQGQWLRMGGRDSSLYPAGEDPDARLDRPSLESIYPAESMTKAEASSLVQRFGLVLPTEAQWEYACRGGSLTKWWWGETFVANPSYVNLADFTYKARKGPEVASDAIDGFARIAPVGCLPPNPFGLYEISGNVCEWCSDPYWYHAYEFPIIDGAGHRDVSGSKAGPELPSVARGGAFQCTYEKTRSAHRYGNADAYAHVGLRPARALILQP